MKNERLAIVLERDADGYPPWDEEELWGRPLGDDLFQLTVTPTFARGLSLDDVVHGTQFDDRWYVDRLVESGGHSTLRVVLFEDDAHDELFTICERHGCDVKHTEIPGLFAVDVQPERSLTPLVAELRERASAGRWDIDEAAIAAHHDEEGATPG